MAAYFIAHFVVKDPALFAEYQKASGPTLAGYTVKFVAVDVAAEGLEGKAPGPVSVVIEFESTEKLKEWYESPAYQAVLPKRLASTEGFTVIAQSMNLGTKK
jgi:uncharacterized protein (DUF1330 family)